MPWSLPSLVGPLALLMLGAALLAAACGSDGKDDASIAPAPAPPAATAAAPSATAEEDAGTAQTSQESQASTTPAAQPAAGSQQGAAASTGQAGAAAQATTDQDEEAEGEEAGLSPAVAALLSLATATCNGEWRNLTFGSVGAASLTFEDMSAEGGVAVITLDGNVFGSAGGTVRVPFTFDGRVLTVDADADFLGKAQITYDTETSTVAGGLLGPHALGPDSTVTLTSFDFELLPPTITLEVDIDFGDGTVGAQSVLEVGCTL